MGDNEYLRHYMAYSQIGFEMVGPIVLGLLLDYWLAWSPWGVIVGAVVGFFTGLYHLIQLVSKEEQDHSSTE